MVDDSKRIVFIAPSELAQALAQTAHEQQVPQGAIVRAALAEYFARRGVQIDVTVTYGTKPKGGD